MNKVVRMLATMIATFALALCVGCAPSEGTSSDSQEGQDAVQSQEQGDAQAEEQDAPEAEEPDAQAEEPEAAQPEEQDASEAEESDAAQTEEQEQAQVNSAGLADGTYEIEVDTDSSMFHVVAATLEVQGEQMTATITLPGEGFSRLYYGTAEEAEAADDADIFEYYLDDEGKYTFDVPVAALDEETPITAWGQRRDRWYDHTITFGSPTGDPIAEAEDDAEEAKEGDEAAGEAVSADDLEDGTYQVDVELDGGTGRADIASPAQLDVDGGEMTLTVVWSSSNYDQMIVDGEQYLPTTIDGGSTFEIPVTSLDEPLPIQAETTAMSEPHMIDYTITFDTGSIRK